VELFRVSIYTTPEYRPQEFAGEEFYFATIEEFEITIDTPNRLPKFIQDSTSRKCLIVMKIKNYLD